jgi:hypothetical protein
LIISHWWSGILRLAVLMRWLLIGLLISVGVLLFVAGAVAWHVLRQKRVQSEEALGKAEDRQSELEPGLDFPEVSDLKRLPPEEHGDKAVSGSGPGSHKGE